MRTFSETLQSAAAATGNGTPLSTIGLSAVALQVTGTFSATLVIEGTLDNVTWVTLNAVNISTGTSATSVTAAGIYRVNVVGLSNIRARVSAYTSGSVTVFGMAIEGAVGGAISTFGGTVTDAEGTLLASAARTATVAFANGPTNYNARGVVLYLNVTVASGTGGLQVQIAAVDPVSANPFILNSTPTAVTTTGQRAYAIYPGANAAAGNLTQMGSAILPRTWQYRVVAGDSSSYTYSLGYAFLP